MLKVGFVGLGTISHEHVLGYLDNPDAEIVAVCCPDEDAARLWLQKWKLSRAVHYTSLEGMLASERLDLVEILTPTYLHAQHAIACTKAKVKGISLQKPMGLTLRECDEIIEECQRNGTTLKVFENYLFYPVYVKAKELTDQGVIGEIMSLRLHTAGGMREGAPWPWCWDSKSWRLDPKTGGVGPLTGDDGHHKFSLARWFMGREFEKVNSWIESSNRLDAPAFIRAKFKGLPGDPPKYAQIDVSFSMHLEIPWDFWLDDFVEIVGSKGIMWINQCQGGADREFFKGNAMSKSPVFPPIALFVNGRVETYPMSDEDRSWAISFVNSTKHFIDVMQGGGLPILSGADGKEILRCILASLISAQEERDVLMDEITTEAEVRKKFEVKTIFCNPRATVLA
jgi:predicted dehydrogenase